MDQFDFETSRTGKAMKGLTILVAILAYEAALIFGDIMFLQVMRDAFPAGILGVLAMAGAVVSAVSATGLLMAKFFWFTPGRQMVGGYIFWFLTILVLGLNTLLAYNVATQAALPGYLFVWHQFSPASPFLAVIGWGIMFQLDDSTRIRDQVFELRSKLHDSYTRMMAEAARQSDVQEALARGARSGAQRFAEGIVGPVQFSGIGQKALPEPETRIEEPNRLRIEDIESLLRQYAKERSVADNSATTVAEPERVLRGRNGHDPKA